MKDVSLNQLQSPERERERASNPDSLRPHPTRCFGCFFRLVYMAVWTFQRPSSNAWFNSNPPRRRPIELLQAYSWGLCNIGPWMGGRLECRETHAHACHWSDVSTPSRIWFLSTIRSQWVSCFLFIICLKWVTRSTGLEQGWDVPDWVGRGIHRDLLELTNNFFGSIWGF